MWWLPVVAMISKPTNPKKQVAAPDIIPENPYGRKPPFPKRFNSSPEQEESKQMIYLRFISRAFKNTLL